MPSYAWVIDQTTCIGCHACTTACKSENDVPLGVNRTWVKYVETGTFPQTSRQMAVLRCNHCADAPCVEICPTAAMYQRPDGIVDFDASRCIGCKACLQACPYDAIFIDPGDHTAEKCNFCSHRVDQGLLPSCVVICPTESLTFGDLDDPSSRASRLVAAQPTTVRRPEQGTRPKAFYIGASEAVLDPLAARHEGRYVWSDRRTGGAKDYTAELATWGWPAAETRVGMALPVLPSPAAGAAPGLGSMRVPVGPAPASTAPAHAAGMPVALSIAPQPLVARVAYDTYHPRPWGWPVALYLWTKGLGAGAFGVFFLALALGGAAAEASVRLAAAFVALAGTGVTAVLLAGDLKRPERFWTILVRAQRRSWLAIGAFILIGYSGSLGLWFLGTLAGVGDGLLTPLGWVTFVLGFWTALYTAFLLAQCEGRDLWQNPVTGVVLIAQATILGAAALLVIAVVFGVTGELADLARLALAIGAALNLGALVFGEAVAHHPTANARAAAHLLTRGPWRFGFWLGGVGLAGVVPLLAVVLFPGLVSLLAAAGIAAAAGLLWYEQGFIAAGQAVPIS